MKIRSVAFTAVTSVLACLLAFSGGAIEAHGEEGAGNNLSYPAVLIEGPSIVPYFTVQSEGLGETYSYGCEGIEMDGVLSYPNTSCVDDLAEPTIYYTAAECTAPGGKCAGKSVTRMYWQKEEDHTWSSQVTGVPTAGSAPVNARYVDWGDSIEVVNWNDYSVLRVETQPFIDLSQDPLPEVISDTPNTQQGFQMWHVSGHGITEQWGARVEEVAGERGLPYIYDSPYAIINSGTADLYLTKLFPGDDDDPDYKCPKMGGDQPAAYPADYPFEPNWIADTGWSGSCNLPVVPYTLEQSVSGKFVYGYNWRVRDLAEHLTTCVDQVWHKTGWWRLTYVADGDDSKVLFTDTTVTGPPVIPPAIPTALSTFLSLSEESDEDEDEASLYTPVVDVVNNLTYIDICIVEKKDTDPDEYYVVSSVNVTGSGTISPEGSQWVEKDDTVSFVLDPAFDYYFGEITGTCPAGAAPSDNGDGTWSYTTGSIKSDCTVIANFFGNYQVSLTMTTVGPGTVVSNPSGIDCGDECIADYDANTEVGLTATADAGSVFVGWSGDCSDDGTLETKVTLDTAKSCTATFTELLYTITASASPTAGGEVICDPNPVLPGFASACTISTNPYYTFDTVTGTCSGTLVGDIYTTDAINADCTVVANFIADQFGLTVTLDGTGTGTVSSSPAGIDCGGDCSEDYDYNTVVTLTAIADAGFGFAGWSGDDDCSDGIVTMDAAKSCIATFAEGLTITASASPADGGGVNCDPNPVPTGSASTCTISTNPNYTFDTVTGTCGGTLVGSIYTTDAISADCTVVANFVTDQFSLMVILDGTGTGTVSSSPAGIDCGGDCSEDYDYNTVVTLTAIADAGSDFTGWSGNSDCSDGIVTMDAAKGCIATFTELLYTITASASPVAGGGVNCDPNPVLPGSDSTCTISTNLYYTLATVSGTCGGTLVGDIYTTAAISADCTVIANFVIDRYSLTVTTVGTGTGTVTSSPAGIDCGGDCSEDYDYNTGVTLTATADADSFFAGWSGDADCLDGIVTMDTAKSCTATFTERYIITASASPVAGGGVSCDPNPVLPGSDSTCTISTNPYYTIDTVTGTCGGTLVGDIYTTDAISADCTVVADFVIDRFSLTVTTAGTGTGTVTSSLAGIDCGDDCSEDYDYNMGVTLTATADAGSFFAGWSGDCSDDGTVMTIVTMDAAKSCIATFTEGYTITASALPATGGGVSCDPNPVLPGSASTCTISTNPYYTLDAVTGTCGGTLVGDIYTTDLSSADCTVIATFDGGGFPWILFLPTILNQGHNGEE